CMLQRSGWSTKDPVKPATFVACIIFTSLSPAEYKAVPGTQWCVAVYSICFVFSLLIVFLTIAKLSSIFPFSFDKAVISFNILAVAMYATAVVIWPLYVFDRNPRPDNCNLIYIYIFFFLQCVCFICYNINNDVFVNNVFFF
uniref:MARVEL domain-containing protein n=1 Tax=Cyprinus carpio TaxID=7962 RepID=A0A8C1SF16_CYPCA